MNYFIPPAKNTENEFFAGSFGTLYGEVASKARKKT
jgi:hypothetical protein